MHTGTPDNGGDTSNSHFLQNLTDEAIIRRAHASG